MEKQNKISICHVITRMIVGGAQENTLFSCIGQLRAGNREFESAAEQTKLALEQMQLPELDWFMAHCLSSFGKNLDQLE